MNDMLLYETIASRLLIADVFLALIMAAIFAFIFAHEYK